MARAVVLRRGSRLAVLADRTRDRAPILKRIGTVIASRMQATFRTQGRGRFPWRARSVPNVAGIVADLAKGATVKPRRFQDRPALIDTGRLRGSISFRVLGQQAVEVGSNVPYASLHHTGGVSVQEITPTVRRGLADFLRRRRDETLSRRLGFLFRADRLETRIPARPFVFLTPQDRRDVDQLVVDWFTG